MTHLGSVTEQVEEIRRQTIAALATTTSASGRSTVGSGERMIGCAKPYASQDLEEEPRRFRVMSRRGRSKGCSLGWCCRNAPVRTTSAFR